MAAVFSLSVDGTGVIHRTEEQLNGTDPLPASGIQHLRRYDETTNPTFAAVFALQANTKTMLGSTVLINGNAYEFEPDGAIFDALLNSDDLVAKTKLVLAGQATYTPQEQARINALTFRANDIAVD